MSHEQRKGIGSTRLSRRRLLKFAATGAVTGLGSILTAGEAAPVPLATIGSDKGPLARAGASYNPTPAGLTPKRGGIIASGMPGDLVDFSPFETGVARAPWHHNLYTPLFYYDQRLNVVPGLGESYTVSDDKLTLTIKLFPGVKFHNGREFTSEDVVFNIRYALNQKTGGAAYSLLQTCLGAIAVNRYTVQLKFKQPTAYIFDALTFMGMIAKEAASELRSRAIGTGPFAFQHWIPGQELRLRRSENYWEPGLPYADTAQIRSFKDVGAMMLSLEAGEVDLVRSLPFSQVDRVRNNKDLLVIQPDNQPFFWNIYLNTKRKPFDNKKVRQALAWSIDRQSVVDSVLYGASEVANTPIPKSSWAYDPGLQKVYGFDLDRARRLLTEAGVQGGFQFTAVSSPIVGELTPIAVIWQQDLKKIGVDMKISELSSTDYAQRINSGDFEVMVSGSGRGHKDPGSLFRIQRQYFSGGNELGWQSSEYDELIAKGAAEFDRAKRKAIYRRIQEILLDACFEIIVARNVILYAMRKSKLHDLRLETDEDWMFHRTWIS
jgi:ABC-type transport system substrate-binding protein